MFVKYVFGILLLIFTKIKAAPLSSNPWGRETITYSILNKPGKLSTKNLETTMQKAFDTWSAVIPLNFTEVSSDKSADIKISFEFENHKDKIEFIGNYSVHTIPHKEIHFNYEISWYINSPSQRVEEENNDLYYTALFAVGKVLGLETSNDPASVMYDQYVSQVDLSGKYVEPKLSQQDIQAAQKIYGLRKA